MLKIIRVLKDTSAIKELGNAQNLHFRLSENNFLRAEKVLDFGDYWLVTLSNNSGDWLVKKDDVVIN